eukprot:g13911.t1
MRNRQSFENEDLDMLHDVEVLGRSLVEALEPKLKQSGLGWKNVILCGFGKGAGVALYAALMKLIPQPVSAMIFFSPVVAFPGYLAERLGSMARDPKPVKTFIVWGGRNKSTPGSYRQLLAQALRKAPEVHLTPDTLPEGDHTFDVKSFGTSSQLTVIVQQVEDLRKAHFNVTVDQTEPQSRTLRPDVYAVPLQISNYEVSGQDAGKAVKMDRPCVPRLQSFPKQDSWDVDDSGKPFPEDTGGLLVGAR